HAGLLERCDHAGNRLGARSEGRVRRRGLAHGAEREGSTIRYDVRRSGTEDGDAAGRRVGRGAVRSRRLEDSGKRTYGDAGNGEQGETSELHRTLPSVVCNVIRRRPSRSSHDVIEFLSWRLSRSYSTAG